jgi:hypothetical protein
MTHGRSETPKDPSQGHELASNIFPTFDFTVQGTPGVDITDRSIDTSPFVIPPVIPYFPYPEDARHHGTYTPTGRTGTGYGASGPYLATRASTSALFTLRRDASPAASDALPSPATGSLRRSFDSRDPGTKVNQATSLAFEDE